jgi:hypothetical protein
MMCARYVGVFVKTSMYLQTLHAEVNPAAAGAEASLRRLTDAVQHAIESTTDAAYHRVRLMLRHRFHLCLACSLRACNSSCVACALHARAWHELLHLSGACTAAECTRTPRSCHGHGHLHRLRACLCLGPQLRGRGVTGSSRSEHLYQLTGSPTRCSLEPRAAWSRLKSTALAKSR